MCQILKYLNLFNYTINIIFEQHKVTEGLNLYFKPEKFRVNKKSKLQKGSFDWLMILI